MCKAFLALSKSNKDSCFILCIRSLIESRSFTSAGFRSTFIIHYSCPNLSLNVEQRLVLCSEEKNFVLVYGMILYNYIAFAYFLSGCIYVIVVKMFPEDSGLNEALK